MRSNLKQKLVMRIPNIHHKLLQTVNAPVVIIKKIFKGTSATSVSDQLRINKSGSRSKYFECYSVLKRLKQNLFKRICHVLSEKLSREKL